MTTDSSLPLRGNYFGGNAYMTVDTETGVMRNRAGRRMIALTDDFLQGFHEALEIECGEAAPEVMWSCGRTFGLRFAEKLDRELADYYGMQIRDFSLAFFDLCFAEALSRHGWGKLRMDYSNVDIGVIVAEIENGVFHGVFGDADAPIETLLSGLLAGMFSHFSGQELGSLQTDCESMGAAVSRFVITLRSRLDDVSDALPEGARHNDVLSALAKSEAA